MIYKTNKFEDFISFISKKLQLKKNWNKIKKAFKKLKYLDKTQLNFYIVITFIAAFCTFTTTTYAAFTLSKSLNAAVITTAKLSYVLSSSTDGYSNGTISVPANGVKVVDLTLTSQNAATTKYALNYDTTDPSIKAYYSENLTPNMSGEIGANGSAIDMRVVLVNTSSETKTAKLTVNGGYINNELVSNITDGYYEQDIVVRTTLLDDNFTNPTSSVGFPDKDGDYAYYKTTCNAEANPTWNYDTWSLDLNNISKQIACDVYFKKITDDIEIYYELRDVNGQNGTISETAPNADYTYKSSSCSSGTANWDETNRKLSVSNIKGKTLCIVSFNKNS